MTAMELKDIILFKSDFKSEIRWLSLCEILDLPPLTQEIELNCAIRAAKIYTQAAVYEENKIWPNRIIKEEDKNV